MGQEAWGGGTVPLASPPAPAGLAELAARKYKQAAKCFLLASFDHCDFPEVRGASALAGLTGEQGRAL